MTRTIARPPFACFLRFLIHFADYNYAIPKYTESCSFFREFVYTSINGVYAVCVYILSDIEHRTKSDQKL